jgi:hypothetical protein
MEKILGPFNGYLVKVFVAPADGQAGKFSASYRICADGQSEAQAGALVQKRVGGLWGSIDEACDIAVQLARLHLAGLRGRVAEAAVPETKPKTSLAEFAKSWCEDEHESPPLSYEPTLPSPLQPNLLR